MSSNTTDRVVAEYLRELESRLGGLPVLQRRELLADVEAHIATERAERGLDTEAEVLEMLERLGSPEVVAAAAYEEAEMTGGQPLVAAAVSPANAGAAEARQVPPTPVAPVIPPPPDPPVFGGPGPSYTSPGPAAGRPYGGPYDWPLPPPTTPSRKDANASGVRVAIIAVAIALAGIVLLLCGGAFMLARSSEGAPASDTAVQEATPVPPTPETPFQAPVAPTRTPPATGN